MKYGADRFTTQSSHEREIIAFEFRGVLIKLEIGLPSPSDEKFHKSHEGRRRRTPEKAFDEWQSEVQRLWRVLALAVKTKLEIVESGVSSFEAEFLSYIVWEGGQTTLEVLEPTLIEAYENKRAPQLLLKG